MKPIKKIKDEVEEEEIEEEEMEEVDDEEENPEEEERRTIKKEIIKPIKSIPKEESEGRFRLVEVPIQTAPAFEDVQTKKIYDQNLLLLKLINDIEEIKKSVI